MAIQIGLIGCHGKMGRRIQRCIVKDPEISLAWGLDATSPRDSLSNVDVIIDFSSPLALEGNLLLAKNRNTPLVIGTTGFEEKEWEAMKNASQSIPLFWAPNFSLGMAVLIHALKTVCPFLQKKFRPQIEEIHHVHKKDKPSGSALACAQAVELTYGKTPPIASFRVGEVIGDHSVSFLSEDETLTFRHEGLSRDAFALGALEAAKFLVDKRPGLYSMENLLLRQASSVF